jgi:hypothetical protein
MTRPGGSSDDQGKSDDMTRLPAGEPSNVASDAADSRLSPSPPKPSLAVEWRLVLVFQNVPVGVEHYVPFDSEAEALKRAGEFTHATWRIDRRYVGPWKPVGPVRRSRVVVENVEPPDHGDDNGQRSH